MGNRSRKIRLYIIIPSQAGLHETLSLKKKKYRKGREEEGRKEERLVKNLDASQAV